MATELLAAGTSKAVSSTTITLAAGESATLLIKGAAGKQRPPLRAHIVVQAQDKDGAWRHHAEMRGIAGSCVISAVGTFRVVRPAQGEAVGVDRG